MTTFAPIVKVDLPHPGDPVLRADGSVAIVEKLETVIRPVSSSTPTRIYVFVEGSPDELLVFPTPVPHSWREARR
jgi:hypothetical protein